MRPSIALDMKRSSVREATSRFRAKNPRIFGSVLHGTDEDDSDLDLLVIKRGKFNHHRVTTKIYRHLSGEIGVDVVVATPEEVERYRDFHCLVICPAMREGKIIYGA